MKSITKCSRIVSILSVSAVIGCAYGDSAFKKSVNQLLACEHKYIGNPHLTGREILDLQADCYLHYKLRDK